MSDIVVTPVAGKSDLRQFIELPVRLYRGHQGYAPHLTLERFDAFSPRKNPHFHHADAAFLLARRDGRAVGRIMVQVDHAHLERHRDATGHFGLLDAEDDPAVFAALFDAAEAWLRARGMQRIAGPFSVSINDEVGQMIAGFDERPMLLMPYGPRYAPARIEAQGYAKLMDLHSYEYDVRAAPVTIGHKLVERYAKGRVRVRPVDMSRFAEEVKTVVDIFNDAWQDNWGFVPMTEEEVAAAAKTMKPLVEPRVIWLAELDDKPVAMILALPNLNEAVADMAGRLLPFNWAKLLWRLKVKRVKSGRVALMGVRMSVRNTPLGAALAMMVIDKLRENGLALGFHYAELGWILETNAVTRRIIQQAGGREYKTYRLYSKPLA
ncbi:MAG: dATP pyrophosphohydrolase [Reyranellaceae bacterium]